MSGTNSIKISEQSDIDKNKYDQSKYSPISNIITRYIPTLYISATNYITIQKEKEDCFCIIQQ